MALLMRKPLLSARPALPRRVVSKAVVCRASVEENIRKAVAVPLASLVAAALLAGAFAPDEALAARSSGRAGGSSGFSSRRSAPAPARSMS